MNTKSSFATLFLVVVWFVCFVFFIFTRDSMHPKKMCAGTPLVIPSVNGPPTSTIRVVVVFFKAAISFRWRSSETSLAPSSSRRCWFRAWTKKKKKPNPTERKKEKKTASPVIHLFHPSPDVSSDVAREREREREREARRHLELGNSMKFGHTSSVSLCLFGLLREREREREKKRVRGGPSWWPLTKISKEQVKLAPMQGKNWSQSHRRLLVFFFCLHLLAFHRRRLKVQVQVLFFSLLRRVSSGWFRCRNLWLYSGLLLLLFLFIFFHPVHFQPARLDADCFMEVIVFVLLFWLCFLVFFGPVEFHRFFFHGCLRRTLWIQSRDGNFM